MDKEALQKQLLDYAWKYFSLHSDQRLKTFHFFIIICTLMSGAIFTVAKDLTKAGYAYAAILSVILALFSFIFWKLDIRNKELIKHGEAALKSIEAKFELYDEYGKPHITKLFSSEEWKTSRKNGFKVTNILKMHMSYSDCFNAVFFIFGVGGLLLGGIFFYTRFFS